MQMMTPRLPRTPTNHAKLPICQSANLPICQTASFCDILRPLLFQYFNIPGDDWQLGRVSSTISRVYSTVYCCYCYYSLLLCLLLLLHRLLKEDINAKRQGDRCYCWYCYCISWWCYCYDYSTLQNSKTKCGDIGHLASDGKQGEKMENREWI